MNIGVTPCFCSLTEQRHESRLFFKSIEFDGFKIRIIELFPDTDYKKTILIKMCLRMVHVVDMIPERVGD